MMVKYLLVSENVITGKTQVILEKKYLVDIDRLIFDKFKSLDDIIKHFNLTDNDNVKIEYKYQNNIKTLDLIYKDTSTYLLDRIIKNTENAKIDIKSDVFLQYITSFMKRINMEKLQYLFDNHYISPNLYRELFAYINSPYDEYSDFYNYVKYQLSNYISFRKLFWGLNCCQKKDNISVDKEKTIVSTEDELLNKLYNTGTLDDVYSVYDLDDLRSIEGVEQLQIDGFSKKIGKRY